MVKSLPVSAGDASSIPGSGRSPGRGNDNPLHILAWKILWTEEPGRLQSLGSQASRLSEYAPGPEDGGRVGRAKLILQ